jgi:hypothetical protein
MVASSIATAGYGELRTVLHDIEHSIDETEQYHYRRHALKQLMHTQSMLRELENKGLDIERANQILETAREAYGEGKYTESIERS